ncbi:Histidine kinase [Saccharopolyspora shandongensis]|uniref:Histidine kinase n=1 Tax=Saccharopolyspora shandongensis TaxID=418495 RepID=A0A1H3IT29_9PSEU|nr:histidine kinase [Saccharopolyspora shandongensis]SDY30717.1 Histidine kinase [Saccharopolyspora shandongensis]
MRTGIGRKSTWLCRLLPGWLRAPGRRTVKYRYELERELHDGPAAGLSALALELGLISATAGDPRLSARIDALRDTICRHVEHARLLGATIHPPTLTAGLGPAWMSVAEHGDLRLRLDLPPHDLDAQVTGRTGLLVADHLRTLKPGTAVQVRVRGRKFVRVHITEQRPGSTRRRFRAVLG